MPVIVMAESMAGVRGYLRELRKSVGVSQEALAEHIGLSRRALIEWEMGRTATLKSAQLFRAVAYLKAPIDEVLELFSKPDLTEEEGKEIASRLTPDERQEAFAAADALTDEELRRFIMELNKDREFLSPLRDLLHSLRNLRRPNGASE